MSKILLSFGHIPKYAGGKQSSGLAGVIWELANNINKLEDDDLKCVLAATDIHEIRSKIDATEVIGWVKKDILIYILLNPWLLFYYSFKAGRLFFKYKLPFFNYLIKLIFYHKTIKKVEPDYIHLHSSFSIVFFEIWKIKSYKIIATIHGLSGQDNSIPGYDNFQKMERDLSKKPLKSVVFITTKVLNDWVVAYGEPVWRKEVILNAYNKDVFFHIGYINNSASKITMLATIGSISERKGQKRVLQALSKIDNSKIHYVCIGNGTVKQIEFLRNFAKNNNISFECTGYLSPDKIRERLWSVDYMILPSSSEGFGLGFLESIACGVPVILPKNLPIVKEKYILSDGNSIFINDESPESIVQALIKLNSFSFEKEKVSRTVLNFSWDRIAMEYLILIKSLN